MLVLRGGTMGWMAFGAAWSPDGTKMATAGETAQVWDATPFDPQFLPRELAPPPRPKPVTAPVAGPPGRDLLTPLAGLDPEFDVLIRVRPRELLTSPVGEKHLRHWLGGAVGAPPLKGVFAVLGIDPLADVSEVAFLARANNLARSTGGAP